MEQLATKKIYSIEEYFALETALVETKHEYFSGEIFAVAGAHPNHNTVCVNLLGELRDAIKRNGKPCRVYNSDQRVRAHHEKEGKTGYFYPDVSVVCGKPEFANDNPPTLLNPIAIVEVLSDSTRPYDFGKKLDYYRAIPSAQDVIFVSYDKPRLLLFHRNGDEWMLRDIDGLEAKLVILSLEIELSLAGVYRDIVFTPAP
ncbi:MAG: Uma2 family endonuclease [Chloroherpetonaceae bacterium]|nr:Uma2 family endonuclease [Chloroherpetonaceae bacterium]MDW8436841.1 Uma2 family endonuclease [Chloroherpetonaceae bacterium]